MDHHHLPGVVPLGSGFPDSQYALDDSMAVETGSLIQRPITLSRRPSGNQLTQLVLEDGGAFSRFDGGGSGFSGIPSDDHLGMMGMGGIGGGMIEEDEEGEGGEAGGGMDIEDLDDDDDAGDSSGGGGGMSLSSSGGGGMGHGGDEQTGRWTKEEHQLFLAALKKYGKEWKKVAGMVKTRTVVQTRTHAQKYFQKLQKSGGGAGADDIMDFSASDVGAGATPSGNGGAQRKAGSASKRSRSTKQYDGVGRQQQQQSQHVGAHGLTEDECDLLLLDDTVSTNGLVALQNATGDLSPLPVHRKSIDIVPNVQVLGGSGGTALTPIDTSAPPPLPPSAAGAAIPLSSSGRFTPVQLRTENNTNSGTANTVPIPPRININAASAAARSAAAKTPLPSPAACGKRKLDELSAARMMAAASSAESTSKHSAAASTSAGGKSQRDDAFAVPLDSKLRLSFDSNKSFLSPENLMQKTKTTTVRKLSIVDPDELRPLSPIMGSSSTNGLEPPNTPWDGALLALTHLDAPVPPVAATPEQLSHFYADLVHLITNGSEKGISDLLATAEAVLSASHKGASGTAVLPLSTILEESGDERSGLRSEKDSSSSVGTPTPVPRTLASMLSSPLNPSGDSALLFACSMNPSSLPHDALLNICKLLVDRGASTAVVNNKGATCLHLTATSGAVDIGRVLIRKGCPLNAIDTNGNTALHIASAQSHLQFIELLIEFGANCHIRNFDARSAIDIAASNVSLPQSHGVWANLRSQTRDLMLNREQRLRTLILYHDDCLKHSPRSLLDWEGPDRLEGIMASLRNSQLFKPHELKITNQFDKADVDLLLRVHCPEYISFVNSLSKQLQGGKGDGDSEELPPVPFTPHVQRSMFNIASETKPPEFCDTTFSAGTLRAARRAAGAVAHAVDCVLLGRNRNAFCVVRPPGHHAGYRGLLDGAKSCGFCIFNNIAAGALHALDAHYCERVAIVDIDIHHGNGTEDIVRKCNRPEQLFFFSVHLYDREDGFDFFPGSGLTDDTMRNIINVPIMPMWAAKNGTPTSAGRVKTEQQQQPSFPHQMFPTTGREAYRQAISLRLLPALRAFNPNLILLSTGFDPAVGDVGNARNGEPGMDVRVEDFEWATTEIMKVADICCNGRLVSVLEGGYGSRRQQASVAGQVSTRKSAKESAAAAEVDAGGGGAAAGAGPVSGASPLDRRILAAAATAHVRRLVDPYYVSASSVER